jgi:DNA mismatch repair protein MutS2
MNEHITPRVLEILEWPVIREELRKRCATPTGESLVDGIAPLDFEAARMRMGKITGLKELIGQNRQPDFSGVTDIGPFVTLAEKQGVLKLEDLAAIRSFIIASARTMKFLRECREEFPLLADEYGRMDRLPGIADLFTASITENGDLSESAYPELRRTRDELRSTRLEMEKMIGGIIHSPHMENILQEKIFTTRNDRYVVLVKSGMKEKVRGTVHDISASGATYYIEPAEVAPLNNRALMLEKELQAEIARILRALSAKVSEHAGPLAGNLEVISGLDFITAAARFSIDTKGSEPEIADSGEIVLYGARHPILSLMSPGTVVANDIDLGESNRCLIISGANTGGKTVLLKTIGLCVLFAMFGLHLPAGPDSRIGVYSRILADIGDDQSLSRSLSTFSGQIVVINEMISAADDRTLVLIDEIIVGTNPRQGAALAQAILESLIETGSRIVVTTHYSELKDLPTSNTRFRNASVSFDMETLRPTYRLIAGLPGVSYAIEIAENYGLPGPVVSRARSLLDSREISMEALIEKVQAYEQELDERKTRLEEIAAGLEREKNEYDGMMKLLEKRAQEIKQKEGIEFLNELIKYRRLVSTRITELQQMNMKEAGSARQEVRKIEDSVHSDLRRDKGKLFPDRYVPMGTEAVMPGDTVFVLSLEKEGTVDAVDLQRKQASVLLGNSIRSTFGFEDLYRPARPVPRPAPRTAQKRSKERARRTDGEIPPVIQTAYNTIDLRGKRVEEGLRIMEQDLDRMVRGGIDTAVVIHGHGTGAMKEAVRENLRHSPYSLGSRPGESGEGGDGVTIVQLRD